MRKAKGTLQREDSTKGLVLKMALELSMSKWKIAFGWEDQARYVTIGARDLDRLQEEIGKAKKRFGLLEGVGVLSCYEAGRDGFWLHRYLRSCGIGNLVVDSSSIEVSRRKRRAKTDRLDARKLLGMLVRHAGGERGFWSVVRVPGEEEEGARHLHRELEVLRKERTMHRNRILSLLILQGVVVKNPSGRKFLVELESVRRWDGQGIPEEMKRRIIREHGRLRTVEEQIYALKKEEERQVREGAGEAMVKVRKLMSLMGIGMVSSYKFVREAFGWREFRNRREVGALAGLTPTPYDSGGRGREQGVSKAGNGRIRALAVEMAWVWNRFQPRSKLSRWYQERFEGGGKRMKRIGIVALARRLLIALWRYLEKGVIPEGARLRPTRALIPSPKA